MDMESQPDTEGSQTDDDEICTGVVVDHAKEREQRVQVIKEYVERRAAEKLVLKNSVLGEAKSDVAYYKQQLEKSKKTVASLEAESRELQASDRIERLKTALYDELLAELGEDGLGKCIQLIKDYVPKDRATIDAYEHVASILDDKIEAIDGRN